MINKQKVDQVLEKKLKRYEKLICIKMKTGVSYDVKIRDVKVTQNCIQIKNFVAWYKTEYQCLENITLEYDRIEKIC